MSDHPKEGTLSPTPEEIERAAAAWLRATLFDDVEDFRQTWRTRPGLRVYVERECQKMAARKGGGTPAAQSRMPEHDRQ